MRDVEILDRYPPTYREFVEHKRSLGYGYGEAMVDLVSLMARHLESCDPPGAVTRESVASFVAARPGEAASTTNKRMSLMRQYALYLRWRGIGCFVPEPSGGRRRPPSFSPRIVTEDEMARVLGVARSWPFRREPEATRDDYALLLELLWCCGLRLGEALSLAARDFDQDAEALVVRRAKHDRTRLVPLAGGVLEHVRRRVDGLAPDGWLFPGRGGGHRCREGARSQIREFMLAAGVTRADGMPPRVHDIRHSFAVAALAKMEASGVETRRALPLLATYMGHSDIQSTELYLRLVPSAFDSVRDAMSSPYDGVFPEVTT